MLRQLRDHSRSYILYILFGIIISVFIINFGPQSSGCSARSNVAGKVGSKKITTNELNYSLNISGINSLKLPEAQRSMFEGSVLDQYLVNQLLADEARKLGMRVGDDEIDDMLLAGEFLSFGRKQKFPKKGDLDFDYDYVSKFIQYNWQVTMKQFKELQRSELLTQKLIQSIGSAEVISIEDAKLAYFAKKNRRKVEYREFSAFQFGKQAEVSDAQIAAAMSSDALSTEAKAYYEENKTSYANTGKAGSSSDAEAGESSLAFADVKKDILKTLLLKKKKATLAKDAATRYLKRSLSLGKLVADDKPVVSPWFGRDPDGKIPGIGQSDEIISDVFDKLKVGEIANNVYQVDDARYYVLRLAEKESADDASWEEVSTEQLQSFMQARQMERIGHIKRAVCEDALKRNLLRVQLGAGSDYTPCASFDLSNLGAG